MIVNPKRPNAADEYVSDLQHRYEELVSGDEEIKEKAYKGELEGEILFLWKFSTN